MKRRRFLHGMLQGGVLSLGLPVLDCMLNTNGNAWADGSPLPVRFGTWFWGCGMNPWRWNPKTEGTDYELTPELLAIAPVREHVTVLTGFDVLLANKPNLPHRSGVWATLTGVAVDHQDDVPGPSLDIVISDAIGTATRFRSLEMSATGNQAQSYSARNAGAVNPNEISPLGLYNRIFGPEFRDPSEAEFVPDPKIQLQHSVLSSLGRERKALEKRVGSGDRQRLNQYFTSLRQLERQLELQLSEPPQLAACERPPAPPEIETGTDIEVVDRNHDLMTDILALAMACDQTRVFNMVYSYGASSLRVAGNNKSHHQLTHEEPEDPELGYQPQSTFFVERSMQAWFRFVGKLAAVKEGDGSLLDNCLVLAHSETSYAKTHDVTGLPMMLAGRAGGRVRTGLHISGARSPVSMVGLTVQQAMGLNVSNWGSEEMQVSKSVSGILA